MRRLMTMREALERPDIFGTILPGETWAAWRIVLIASQGEPLTEPEREVFRELSGGREREPDRPCREVWGVIGRRGGKTRAFAVAAAYFARLVDYTGDLAPGQRGRIPVMAATKDQAQEALNYLIGIFTEVPDFAAVLDGAPIEGKIRLTTGIDIQVMTASFRTTRGPTPVAAIADEVAFWAIEGSANPDTEVLRALRPGLATLGSPLFVLSSPYAKRGALWDAYRKHYGPAGNPRVLVLQAPTQAMHQSATLAEEEAEAYRDDPTAAAAEWGARFRDDVSSFVTYEEVMACVMPGVVEIPPTLGRTYAAFVDVSGAIHDSHTLGIAHRDGDLVVLDVVREIRGGSPDAVTAEFAALLRSYGLGSVSGDRYGAMWVQERFAAHGITYNPSERFKSQIYLEWLPVLNSRRCRLLDQKRLIDQLTSLERITARGTGRDTVDHPKKAGAHDDISNAACGAIVLFSSEQSIVELYARLGADYYGETI